jgi:hypothetical protein
MEKESFFKALSFFIQIYDWRLSENFAHNIFLLIIVY